MLLICALASIAGLFLVLAIYYLTKIWRKTDEEEEPEYIKEIKGELSRIHTILNNKQGKQD